MDARTPLNAAYDMLSVLLSSYQTALDGIPDDDLNGWDASATENGGGEMTRLGPLGGHVVGAGTWMLEHQVFGLDSPRDRDQEFVTPHTRAELDAMFATMLTRFRELIDTHGDVDLAALPPTIRDTVPDWNRMMWLLHMIDHTALHVGHAQIQRQLWLAERGASV